MVIRLERVQEAVQGLVQNLKPEQQPVIPMVPALAMVLGKIVRPAPAAEIITTMIVAMAVGAIVPK